MFLYFLIFVAQCHALVSPTFEKPLIDLRSNILFEQCHVSGATSLPLPQLEERLYELPAPFEAPLSLVAASDQDLERGLDIVTSRGWEVASSMVVSDPAAAFTHLVTEHGDKSVACWRPSSFLRSMLIDLNGNGVLDAALRAAPEDKAIALDLGCGSGRDAVFLAQQLGSNWRVIGVDNHGDALQRAARLAERSGVGDRVTWLNRDLRKHDALADLCNTSLNPDGSQPAGRVSLVHGCRFLDKSLLRHVRDTVLASGGVFIWSTFMEGTENLAPPFRTSRRLLPGELREIFEGETGTWECSDISSESLKEGTHRTYERRLFRVLHDECGVLVTRKKKVPAQFFAACDGL